MHYECCSIQKITCHSTKKTILAIFKFRSYIHAHAAPRARRNTMRTPRTIPMNVYSGISKKDLTKPESHEEPLSEHGCHGSSILSRKMLTVLM